MPPKKKERLDSLLVNRGIVASRQKAQALILAGKIRIGGQPATKAGQQIDIDTPLDVHRPEHEFASRGGLKLAAALKCFDLDVHDWICLDVGASTGGWTDCLLQNGARKVFAVDVGYGQIAWKLRQDPRVEVMERSNIRYLSTDAIPLPVDLGVIDVSFISLRIVVPATLKFIGPGGCLVVLIKPQFEVGKGMVGKGGIVKDPLLHQKVIQDLKAFWETMDLHCPSVIPSPILGAKGNREFLALLEKPPSPFQHHS
jgi:23S rRNA (cytidine1920-2'-O)/16S rRNA (cytidine1409-2'-O)-methyltransferase